jgi:hypothetical protein
LPVTPVPLRLDDTVPAPVEKDRVPLRDVPALGAKRTETVQVAPEPKEVPQVVEEKLKSVPDTEAAPGVETLIEPMPVFCSVAVWVELEPTPMLPKEMPDRVALGAWPVPLRLTLATPPPLWVKLRVPVRLPAAAGVKLTLTVQVPLTATEPQLLDCAKSLEPVEIPTPVKVSVFVPVFVTVTVCVPLVVLVCWAEKDSDDGDTEA